jgi:lysophospholipase L1-like esterase
MGGSASGGTGSGGKTGSGGSASGGTGTGTGGGSANGGSTNGGSANGGAANRGGASSMGGGGSSAMGGGTNGGTSAGGSGGGDSFDPCPASGACKILPLGDSITFGIQYEGAWRVELFSKAVAAGKKITFVGSQMNGPSMAGGQTFPKNHEGHSGYTIDQMKPFAMTTDVPYMPNMILLHIGTNDTYGSSPSGAPGRLSSLVDLITSTYPNALLAVAKIVPYPAQAANVKIINDSIPALVMKNQMAGKHVIMVDCFTGFMTSSMLSSDSIHPNKTGYDFMGDQFYAAVASYLH